MVNDKFVNILQKSEKIIWCEGVNKSSYILKGVLRKIFIVLFLSLFFGMFLGAPLSVALVEDVDGAAAFFITNIITIASVIFTTCSLYIIVSSILHANNTYFAITNKRIIKRSGALNNKYTHYSLKNVGNIEVVGSVFDSKGEDGSADLIITTKDFHHNTDGNSHPIHFIIPSLKKAYKAYSLLSEQTEGNNEVIRIKTEE